MDQFLPEEGVQLRGILEGWANVDPHVILFVFLPTLIFESAFSVDFHVFRKSFWQILALAVPGMVLGTLLTAAVTHSLFQQYDWTFTAHLMLGSILAATDPVAVVALLKELGASKPLETLIEGESLLNDGSAIVLFSLVRGILTETIESSPGAMVGMGVQLAAVGPIWGAVCAIAITVLLGYVYNDAISEVTMTVVGCYTAFAAAEGTALETSGVLAVVTLGVLMSGYAKTRVSPEVEHTMHSFWELLGYLANTVIFLLSGLIIAEKALFSSYVGGTEFLYLIVLYIALHAVRIACVLVCYPVLAWSGYPLDWRSAIVLSYAGLRGAVGLSLGLIVEQDENIEVTLRERVLFYVAGIAFLTLLINGPTTKLLLGQLGLGKESPVQRRMFEHASDLINSATGDSATELTGRDEFAMADWNAVWSYIPVYSRSAYFDRISKGRVPGTDASQAPQRVSARWGRYLARYDPASAKQVADKQRRESWWWQCLYGEKEEVEADDDTAGALSARRATLVEGESRALDSAVDAALQSSSSEVVHVDAREAASIGSSAPVAQGPEVLAAETRRRFIAASKAAYWHRHEAGLLGRDALRLLLLAESEELDHADTEAMHQWDALESLVELPSWLLLLRRFEWLHCVTDSFISGYVATAYDVAVGFAHGQAAVRRARKSWSIDESTGSRIAAESET